MELSDQEYKEATDWVLYTLFPAATGAPYNDNGERSDEEVDALHESFKKHYDCACGVRDEWYSPEGLIDHFELNPECYRQSRRERGE